MIMSGVNSSNTTPYTRLSQTELLQKFRSNNWVSLDKPEKLVLLQEIENRKATQQGRKICQIRDISNPNYGGSYSSTSNTISINICDGQSPAQILDSYYHESRHAQQNYSIQNGIGIDARTKDMCEIEVARDENGSFYNYTNTCPQYDMQVCEMDSNNYAAQQMIEKEEIFQEEKQFTEYLDERIDHFSKVNKNCQTYAEDRKWTQEALVDNCVERGGISEYNAERIKADIASPNPEPVLQESIEVENDLKETRGGYQLTQNIDKEEQPEIQENETPEIEEEEEYRY